MTDQTAPPTLDRIREVIGKKASKSACVKVDGKAVHVSINTRKPARALGLLRDDQAH